MIIQVRMRADVFVVTFRIVAMLFIFVACYVSWSWSLLCQWHTSTRRSRRKCSFVHQRTCGKTRSSGNSKLWSENRHVVYPRLSSTGHNSLCVNIIWEHAVTRDVQAHVCVCDVLLSVVCVGICCVLQCVYISDLPPPLGPRRRPKQTLNTYSTQLFRPLKFSAFRWTKLSCLWCFFLIYVIQNPIWSSMTKSDFCSFWSQH